MRQFKTAVCAAFAATALWTAAANGAEGTVEEAKEFVNKFVDINVMVATTYTYGFNRPDSNQLSYEVINKQNDTFALYDAFLKVSRNREDEMFGFTIDMDFGETAKFAGSDWNGNGFVAAAPPLSDNSEEGNAFELREAFGTVKLPVGDISLKVGKFVTLLGYEVLMTNTTFNPNLSNSILFGYGINFTNVGLMFNVPMGEMAWIDVGLVNGWDNAVDNNHDKTLMAGLGVKPLDILTLYLAGTFGSEQNGLTKTCVETDGDVVSCAGAGAGSKRGVVTLNATVTPIEGLSFIMDSVYGNESDLTLPDGSGGTIVEAGQWYGLVGYVTWMPGLEPVEGLSLNFRAEVFDDVDGTRLPGSYASQLAFGTPETVWEITPTIAYHFNDNIMARIEYRYDASNKYAFAKKGTTTTTVGFPPDETTVTTTNASKIANTLAAEFVVAF